ncbi:hypothetical protein [Pseudofrankia asymbiotica]|uniref:Uncharacterized protein n=1 Tax=Pseudofrankia asymbiotica TaxID=1834516 RepID=A0A1V2HYN4_9ACTN|nr:hypothetical protein [Pseudofrankia asymbiotica]ONH21773.1 hypothetical protein BL253_37980 [Pseudofrankia asymbiotica]
MGWHARAAELASQEGAELEVALLLLEHAASGLLHRPAVESVAGSSALMEVDQAACRLEACGVRVHPSFAVGEERVEAVDVRPSLVAAAARLAAGIGTARDPEPVAYAAIFARYALRALDDG